MSALVRGLEPQPKFPHEDVSEANAQMLELLLASDALVESGHVNAEQLSPFFKLGHPSIDIVALRLDDSPYHQAAISSGVASMETIKGLLDAFPLTDSAAVHINTTALTSSMHDRNVRTYADSAYDSFVADVPRAAEVIQVANRRRHGYFLSYALLGAALAYQLELDCT